MKLEQLPPHAMIKLMRIDAAEKEREEQNAKIRVRIAFCRQRSSCTDDREEHHRLDAELRELVSKHGAEGPRSRFFARPVAAILDRGITGVMHARTGRGQGHP